MKPQELIRPIAVQSMAIDAVDWFITGNPRSSGHSTLVAWRYIINAIKYPGFKFYLNDFGQHPIGEYPQRRHFADLVWSMINKLDDDIKRKFKFYKNELAIEYQENEHLT